MDETKKEEVLYAGRVVFLEVLEAMVRELGEEVIREEQEQAEITLDEDGILLFDGIELKIPDDTEVVIVEADDAHGVQAQAGQASLPPPISVPTLKRKIQEVDQEEEIDNAVYRNYVKAQKKTNTVKKTASVVRKVQAYISAKHQEKRDLLAISPSTLNSLMCSFIMNVTKDLPKGADPNTLPPEQVYHQPETLTSYFTGVARYLRENGYPYCVISDPRFNLLKDVLKSRREELKKMGLGNHPNAAIPLSDEDIEQCWATGAFGPTTPRTLQATMYFLMSNCFGWRARDESYEAVWGDVVLHEHGEHSYLQWNERTSKTRKGNSAPRKFPPRLYQIDIEERCGVRLYQLWASKRATHCIQPTSHLFLTPKYRGTIQMEVGYADVRMSYNSIGKIMHYVKQDAGLLGQVKGHSVRKTAVTNLLHDGVPPVIIAQLTGHQDLNSLNSYATASEKQQIEMSNILQGADRPGTSLRVNSKAPSRSSTSVSRHGPPSAAAGSVAQLPDVAVSRRAPPSAGSVGQLADVAGMFSGATIQGNVNINIHYGHSSTSAHSTTTSVSLSPQVPSLPLEPNFDEY